jgi:hypothetical protein
MKLVSRMDCSYRAPVRGKGKTLGQLMDEKVALVAICKQCKHRKLLYPAPFAAALGRQFQAIDLRARLRCSRCRCRAPNLHEMTR